MKKGIIHIMIANIINLIIGVLTNFIFPKFLSIESYAAVKTYALYITYAGFFHLGYNDGMYLKYGGKKIDEIDKNDLADNYVNYILLIVCIQVLIIVCGILYNNMIIIAFAFGMFSFNILGYLKALYQATGEFKEYSKALNIEKIIVFIISMILIFILKSDNSVLYIWLQVIVGVGISIYLTIKLEMQLHFLKKAKISYIEIRENIKSGFILMLGNFSSNIFTGLDRWFIKILLTTTDFAMYSFAVSMENILNVFITPITVSMYNYFCKNPPQEKIRKIKNYVLIWGTIIIGVAFPAKFILEKFLNNYRDSNSIIFILFLAQLFMLIVKGIYVNIYKSLKQQSNYLKQMIIMIILGILLNCAYYYMFKSMSSIAMATLTVSIIWLILCEYKFKEKFIFSKKEIIAILIISIVYLGLGYKFNAILGCIIYYVLLCVIYIIFFKETINDVVNIIKQYLEQNNFAKKFIK